MYRAGRPTSSSQAGPHALHVEADTQLLVRASHFRRARVVQDDDGGRAEAVATATDNAAPPLWRLCSGGRLLF